jgi:MFS family permease
MLNAEPTVGPPILTPVNELDSFDFGESLPSGVATPAPLLSRTSTRHGSDVPVNHSSLAKARAASQAEEVFSDTVGEKFFEMGRVRSRRLSSTVAESHPLDSVAMRARSIVLSQGIPPELKNIFSEVIFILVCTIGQVIFALTFGHITVVQTQFKEALDIPATRVPWVLGSSLLASGLSVIIAGPLADLAPPKPLMVGAFIWQAAWNLILAFSIRPKLKVLFFMARAMQGLSCGVLVSASMSILGRVYKPGIRKTRVFSLMAAGAPFGFWIGCLQGGALSRRLPWIFGSTSIFLGLCAIAAQLTLPNLKPAKDHGSADVPSIRQFDFAGAIVASVACGLILFGLTQGPSTAWSPYTYSLIIAGLLLFIAFYLVENIAPRPLIPNALWRTPGFAALLISYLLGFGGYSGAWQFYAIQFWQRYQNASPLTTAFYILPNAIVGVLATWIVSKTLHVFPGHWILTASMFCYGLGPVFFIPQTPNTSYWVLSMPGVALATLGPDMSFAAAAIFITSSVPRSYQGAAGSLLVTVQNLTAAIFTSLSDSIGAKVEELPSGEVGLNGIRAIWWFGFAVSMTGALITGTMVRIPKATEKEHVH